MNFMQELVTGLHVTVRAARQRACWMALVHTLFSWPMLAALAIPAALITITLTAMGPWPAARPVVAILAFLLGTASVLRAWCPLLAKVAMNILGLRLDELPVPAFWRFFLWCALTVGFLALVNVVPLLLPDWTLWIVVPLVALVFSAFLVRCMLCVHADTDRYRAVLRRTIVHRTLLWIPVSLVPYLLFALIVRLLRSQAWWRSFVSSDAGDVISSALACVALVAITVLVLVLWGALSLQALQSRQAARPPPARRPVVVPVTPVVPAAAATRVRRPATAWLLGTGALVLFGIAVAGANRMALVHHYLRYTDARYQPALGSNRIAFEHLHRAMIDSACKGDLGFLKKLIGLDLRPGTETLGRALECAVARSDAAMSVYLLDSEASTDNAFRNAVAARNLPMVRLLVARGAAANRYEGYSKELGMAATSRDFPLMKILIDGGAVQDGYSDAGRVAIYEYLMASVPADGANASWEKVVDDGVAAGLQLKSTYKKADGVLHFAASKGYLGLVEVLLARGMDPKVRSKGGMLPFMQLAAWYPGPGAEPGPEFERALLALSGGIPDINTPVTVSTDSSFRETGRQANWTIAHAAAMHQRVRTVFGERVDYAGIGQWPVIARVDAVALMADLSDAQLASAPPLAPHWRASGWEDLARQAEQRQR